MQSEVQGFLRIAKSTQKKDERKQGYGTGYEFKEIPLSKIESVEKAREIQLKKKVDIIRISSSETRMRNIGAPIRLPQILPVLTRLNEDKVYSLPNLDAISKGLWKK